MNNNASTIDEYLAAVPPEERRTLEDLRRMIKAIAPEAVEVVGYGLPGFKYRDRPLIYFGAAKNHLALYGAAVAEHKGDLTGYDTAKGTIRFKPEAPLPESLVRLLVEERMTNIDTAAASRKRK